MTLSIRSAAKTLAAILLLVALSGCGALPWNPQGYAGVTHVELQGCDDEEGIDGQLYCDIIIYDGKEKTDLDVVVKRSPDGTIEANYRARNVEAFGGQAIRGEVEQAITGAVQAALPEITRAVIDGINATPD
jgi:hypothetical protein